jgi:hypothetical protein
MRTRASLQAAGNSARSSLNLLQRNRAPSARALVAMTALATAGVAVAYTRRSDPGVATQTAAAFVERNRGRS